MSTVSEIKVIAAIRTLGLAAVREVAAASGLKAPEGNASLYEAREALADAYQDNRISMADVVTAYFGEPAISIKGATLGEFMRSFPNFQGVTLERELDCLEADSAVGEDCCIALVKANELIEICADMRDQIVVAVQRQMEIFYFG